MDAAFGNWLAGFIDGEGCFIVREPKPDRFYCEFSIEVRFDDAPIIEEIHRKAGIGTIKHRHRPGPRGNDCPQISWNLQSRSDCMILMQILDVHPLRAKKARDYAIWRMALKAQYRKESIAVMREYKNALSDIKRYESVALDDEASFESPQLRLVGGE